MLEAVSLWQINSPLGAFVLREKKECSLSRAENAGEIRFLAGSTLVSKLDLRVVLKAFLNLRSQKRAGPESSQSCSVAIQEKTGW